MILNFELYILGKALEEGLTMTYPADKVVKYIRNKYNLTDDDIDIDNDIFTDYILVNKIIKDSNIELYNKIEHLLKSSGYYFAKFEGENDCILTFEKKY